MGTLDPDSILTFTFSDPISIDEVGNYTLKTTVDYASDQNPENDVLETMIAVVEGSSLTPGNIQTMDSFDDCTAAPVCELVICELGQNWVNLVNEEMDDIDFRTYHGTTNTIGTGPSGDHTTGTSDGKYLYLEPSVACFNKMAILSMPCIDLTDAVSPALDFWYHAYGADIGRFHIDIFNGSDIIMDYAQPISGNQGDEWKNMTVDLSEFVGTSIGLRFRGYTGGGEKGDFAIDDISITDITAIGQIEAVAGNIDLYPNPSNGYVNVSIQNAGKQIYDLNVSDIYGRLVYSSTVYPENNAINKAVDLSRLSPGIYFVRMDADGRSYQSKLTIK
jgi:hypothetical protein